MLELRPFLHIVFASDFSARFLSSLQPLSVAKRIVSVLSNSVPVI